MVVLFFFFFFQKKKGKIHSHSHVTPLPEDDVVHLQRRSLLPHGDVDQGPPRLDGLEGAVDGDLDPGGVEAHVRPLAAGQTVDLVHDVGGRRVDDVVGTEFPGEFPPPAAHLADDDVVAPFALEGLDDGQADGSAPQDQGGVARLEGGDRDRVPADGQGFDQGADLERDAVGQGLDAARGHGHVLAQPTPPAAQADEAVLVAAVDQAAAAGPAVAVVDGRLHAHPVARPDVRHPLPHLLDDARELVAEREREGLARDRVRVLGLRDQVRAPQVLVQVGPADAAELGGDLDLARFDGRDGDLVEPDVTLSVETDGVHGF